MRCDHRDMPFNPLSAVGAVVAFDATETPTFSGTCFLFRHSHIALTANHCVPETAAHLRLEFPGLGRFQRVEGVERHATADLAVITTERVAKDNGQGYPDEAFWDCVSNWSLGEPYMTYGFPSEGPAPDSPVSPTPRIFVGNFQRFFEYRSPAGYAYLAAELSGTAPSGLSGGPIFRQGAPQMLTGMVTANVESYAITDSLEEMREGGEVFRLESRRVISYGIGLLLGTVSDWLHEVIPERPGMAGSPDDEARPERVCPVRWHGIVRASFSPIFRGSPFAANRTSAFVVPPVSFPTIAWATPRSRAPPARDDSFATVPIVASTALVVTVGDQRTVCSPQPAAADRRPPARGASLA